MYERLSAWLEAADSRAAISIPVLSDLVAPFWAVGSTMLRAHWPLLLRSARSHLPFPIEHQKQSQGYHSSLVPVLPNGEWSRPAGKKQLYTKEKCQGCICVLGTPCKYSTHRATLMVMGMAAPRPLYVTSPPTAATIRRTMQVHGQTSTSREQGGGGRGKGDHTPHAPCSQSLHRGHICIYLLCFPGLMKLYPFFSLQVSSPSTVGFFSPSKQL